MKITRLAGALGAEITDFDLKTVQTQKDAEILKKLLTEHSVIFFPEQRLNPEEHIALGRLFGNWMNNILDLILINTIVPLPSQLLLCISISLLSLLIKNILFFK